MAHLLAPRSISTLSEGEHSDGGGLYLWVGKYSKTWKQRFSLGNTRGKKTLGQFPALSLAEARIASIQFKEKLQSGIPPSLALHEENFTFREVMEEWFKNVYRTKVEEKTLNDARMRLNNHANTIMEMPVNVITSPILQKMLDPLSENHQLETLKKVADKIRQVLTYAKIRGYVTVNAADDVKKAFGIKHSKRQPTIKAEELHRLFADVQTSTLTPQSRDLLMLYVLTAVRASELVGGKWENIIAGTLTIEAEFMKGLRFTRKSHDIYLSTQAQAIIARQTKKEDSPFIFSLRTKPKNPASPETITAWLREESSLSGELVTHGFRSMFSTWANEQVNAEGLPLYHKDAIEVSLSHGDPNKIREIYNGAQYASQRLRLMQGWGDYVQSQYQKALLEKGM